MVREQKDKGTRGQGDKGIRGDCHTFVSPSLSLCRILLICAIVIAGCGEGSPLDPQDSAPVAIPGALLARQFPTADGSSWEYVSTDGDHSYTARIDGTRNVGGYAVRIQKSDSEIPVTQLGLLYGYPIHNSFFTKDLDSYTEYAFELWLLPVISDTFFQRNSPRRVLWSFPLYAGKEWTVSRSLTAPEILYTRKVISDKGVITVPAGTFGNVYYIEEYSYFADLLPEEQIPPSKYWIAPDVGVIKYGFEDPILGTFITYELKAFQKGAAPVEAE